MYETGKGHRKNRFASLVDKWNIAIDHNPKTRYSASIHSYAKLPEFIPLKSMGKQIVPLIMERMINPSDFYFLVLYEAVLEGNETKDDSKFSESEQITFQPLLFSFGCFRTLC